MRIGDRAFGDETEESAVGMDFYLLWWVCQLARSLGNNQNIYVIRLRFELAASSFSRRSARAMRDKQADDVQPLSLLQMKTVNNQLAYSLTVVTLIPFIKIRKIVQR